MSEGVFKKYRFLGTSPTEVSSYKVEQLACGTSWHPAHRSEAIGLCNCLYDKPDQTRAMLRRSQARLGPGAGGWREQIQQDREGGFKEADGL